MRMSLSVVLGVSLLFAATDAGAATIVYEQLPGAGSSALFNSSTLDGAGNPPGFTTADDFLIGGGAIITDLSWWGRSVGGGDNFVFTFYADGGGVPGAVLHTTGGTLAGVPDDPGGPTGPVTLYSSTLAAPFAAAAGTRYWLSIFNGAADASWNWLIADSNSNGAVQGTNPGPPWDRPASDLAFQLSTTVPEPATLALIGAGLGLAATARRRRRRLPDPQGVCRPSGSPPRWTV
jgi:hypothetical protein